MALASEICPASSTKRTSTAFANSGRAHMKAVPPRTSASRLSSARRASSLSSSCDDACGRVRIVIVGRFLRDAHVGAVLRGFLADGDEQIRDDLVARRHDADALALRDERADHAGAGVRLSGAGRALNGEDGVVELVDDVDREVGAGVACRSAGWLKGAVREARRLAIEQRASDAVRRIAARRRRRPRRRRRRSRPRAWRCAMNLCEKTADG